MSVWHLTITILMVFSLLCTIAVLFFERKNPSSSIAWALVLIFLPIFGFIAYLFIGNGFRVNKRKKYALKAANDDLYNNFILKHLNLHQRPAIQSGFDNYSRLLTYLNNQCRAIYTENNAAEVFLNGTAMFSSLVGDMRNARNHIHLLFYIFRDDEVGRKIVEVATEKAKEGVEVRIMYDSLGSMLSFDPMFRELKKAGGEVLAFAPLFSNLSSHLRLNYRNHRKIAVIDGIIGYVGGMNIGEEYMSRNPEISPWRDTHMRMTGGAVWFLQERFMMDWGYESDQEPPSSAVDTYFPEPIPGGDLGVQIVSSGPDTYEYPIKSAFLELIYSATKTIYIQTPYFAPDQSLLDALRIAAHSDVDVRLMVPLKGDYDIVQRATYGYVREALDFGMKAFLYDGFIHAKTMVVDGMVTTIGTTNMTNRSFTLDFEINAFVYNREFAIGNEKIFYDDQENSFPVDHNYFAQKSTLTRASYNGARLLAPMM